MLTLEEADLAKKVATGRGAAMVARNTDNSHPLSKNSHQNQNTHGGKKDQNCNNNDKNNGGNRNGVKSNGGGGRSHGRNSGWQQQSEHKQWPTKQR